MYFISYVKLTREGRTARVPLLCGTNLVRRSLYLLGRPSLISFTQNEGTLLVEGEPTAYLPNIVAYR